MQSETQTLGREDHRNEFVCSHINDRSGAIIPVNNSSIASEIEGGKTGSRIVSNIYRRRTAEQTKVVVRGIHEYGISGNVAVLAAFTGARSLKACSVRVNQFPTEKIREIAEDVYKTLGSGFSEDVYDRAIQVGLRLAKIGYEGEKVVELKYKDHYVGEGYPDLVVHFGR